jgi:hypothetical protein
MQAIDRIYNHVTAWVASFKERILQLPPAEIYDKAFTIHIVEEIAYCLCEHADDYADDTTMLRVLKKLMAGDGIMPVILEWAMSQDSVDVTNAGQTLQTMQNLCEQWKETDYMKSSGKIDQLE